MSSGWRKETKEKVRNHMVKIQVPATSANLGPGYDTMGMAFQFYNYVSMEERPGGLKITLMGEGKGEISCGEDNIVYQAAHRVFERIGFKPRGLHIVLENNIPIARGLGSSASIIAGGMLAANLISGKKINQDELLNMAVEMEGHPDNIVPVFQGGITVAVREGKETNWVKITPPPQLYAVAAIPQFQLSTKISRQSIPETVPMVDAVFNLGRAALMVAALMKQDLGLFGTMMEDKLHQQYRTSLIPGMVDVFEAAKKEGALSVALSGSGPTIIAFTVDRGEKIAGAIAAAFRKHGIRCRTMTLFPDNNGAKIIT